LEPTDDLLEQTYSGTDDRPIDVDYKALPVIDLENITHGDTRIGSGGMKKVMIRRNTTQLLQITVQPL
jgi:hypothetical protein